MASGNAVNGAQAPLIRLAYDTDIPGTRCGPEDGPWPRPYQVLHGPEIWQEMSAFAKPQSVLLDTIQGWRADAINFQPCLTTRTQDRYVIQRLDVHGRTWTLTGVFDGPYSHIFVSDGDCNDLDTCRSSWRCHCGAYCIPFTHYNSGLPS